MTGYSRHNNITAMFYYLGKLAVRFRWPIIILWIAALAALLPFALNVSSQLKAGFGNVTTESDVAHEIIQTELGQGQTSIALIFRSDSLTYTDPQYGAEVESVLKRVREMSEVAQTITATSSGNRNMVSADGRTSYATVVLNAGMEGTMGLYPQLREKAQGTEHLQVWVTGTYPIFTEIRDLAESDLRKAEVITFPLVLVALVIVFGGLVAAGLPVMLGGMAVAITLGLLNFIARGTEMSVFTLNLASLLGLGIAIDYALVMVSRFREEIAISPIEEAVARTMATAGRAILFSAATSVLGLSGLMLFELMMLRSLGLGGIVVILVSMLVALTLLPAVMAVAGKRINSLSIIPMRKSQTRPWHRLAGWVMRYPLVVSVPLIIFLVFLGTPTLGIKIGAPWTSHLPPTAHTREGWDVAAQELGKGELSPMLVVVRSPDKLLTSQNIGALYDLAHEIEADGRVQRVESVVTFDPRMTKAQYQLALSNPTLLPLDIQARLKKAASEHSTVLQVFSKYDPASDESRALMRNIRTIEHAGDFGIYVGGSTAGLADYIDVMYGDFPWVVLYVLGTIYIALLLLFRSLVIPLKAVIMNAMSIFASYGALVFIFQQGHFQELLGFQATGYLEPTIPIILFCIVFGLSMDYELFLLTRVKEIYDSSHDNTHSVGEGLERTGSIITSAALILVLVAASFASGQVVLIKALGIGVAIAVFLDATVVRALLVPALMRIMGDWNWWAPRWLLRLLPQWHVPS